MWNHLISGKLIVSRYIAESITMIAGCFGLLATVRVIKKVTITENRQ